MTEQPSPSEKKREIGVSTNPVLVRELRGGLVESVHRAAFAIADPTGRLVASLGDGAAMVYPRSAIKLIQALPLIETGAASAFDLGDQELALACASHNGEPEHIAAVAAWLSRIGCREDDLACGPHVPGNAAAAAALVRAGRQPGRIHNNCSGKHTGFLSVARHLGVPVAGYAELDHPVQQHVMATLGALGGIAPSDLIVGTDGCGAPNFALPLRNLATAFACVADPSALAAPRRAAIARLTKAVREQPFFIAGTGRLCTRIIESGAGVVPKGGAEGVYVAALPRRGLGLALKIDDGAKAASECLLIGVLTALGELTDASPLAKQYLDGPILNTQGRVVGKRTVDLDAIARALPASLG